MAEFKLGRIRFVWKGDWAASTVYWKDDVVRHGGNTFICIKGYTSTSDFQNDLATYWNKSSDGQEWKGDWTVATYYKINDIVKNGGYLYVANEGHTSAATAELGLENDQAKWDLFAEFFNYNADWTIATAYKINDIVKYGGTAYICITSHTSAATTALGLEQDQAKWQIFSEGFNWKDTWTANYRYRVNDIVRDGGIMYVCITGHTSAATNALGLEADQAKWQYAHKGIDYRSDWTTGTRYKVNDVVKDGGGIWICITHHTSQTYFTDDQAKWSQFVEGLEFEDSWDPGTRYQPGDMITYGGYSYVAITNNLEKRPIDNPTDWDLFTTGFRFREDWGDDSTNEEYHVGDVVRLGGYTYLCKADSSGHRPPNATYWERLNSGMYWKNAHADATLYDAGDTVRQGVSSYICVAGHTSNTGVNDPASDGPGNFWNLLAGGPETDALTTAGDLLYHSGAGAARLPIGTPGQVLSVNTAGNAPEWAAYGKINNIFYADSSIGENEESPSYGVTLSRPWKNLQYACDQIDRGALRPNAKKLLEQNRGYIQAEIREYVKWNTENPTGIWVGYSCDNLDKCERDQGYIIDALIHDISHGGNKGIRDLTMNFFNGGHYPYAERLIENNKQFLIDEVMAWFDATNPTVHTAARHALCERDTGYNIDAILHDIKHGGQDESVRVSKLYWSGASSQLGAGEITYALAINNKLRDIINDNILTNSGSYSRYQNRGKITTDSVHGRIATDLVEVRDIAVTCPQGSKTYPLVSTTTAFTVLGTGLTATEFQVTLGTSSIAQSYVSGGTVVKAGGARLAITGFDYNIGTGVATITTATHTLSASDTVNLFGIITTCEFGKKVYPQMPFSGIYAVAEAPTTSTLNIFLPPSEIEHNYTSGGTVKLATSSNVGGSTAITNFVYDNTTGYTTITSSTHGLAIGDYVKLGTISVTCTLGGNVETIVYPDQSIMNNIGSGIFTVYDVPDANTYVIALDKSAIAHTYVSGGTSQKITIATSASVNISGFTFANGNSTQWFDVGDGEASAANRITYLTSIINAITQNGLGSVPTSLPLLTSINDEIDQTKAAADYGTTVIDAVLSNALPATSYQAKTSRGYLTTATHGRSAADLVEVRDIAVTCPQGSKTYPLVSTTTAFTVLGTGLTATEFEVTLGTSSIAQTYVSGGTVVKAGGARLAITDFVYNTGTGVATITTATHTLSASDTVNLFGIKTSCEFGIKIYPQMPFAGIYPVTEVPDATHLNIFLPGSNVAHTYTSGGTVKLATPSNSGGSTAITGFVYDNTTGYTTVTSTSHTLAIGDYVKLDAITVSCVYGNKVYPDTTNSSGIFTVYDVPDANTYVVALDKGNFAHTYVSGGTSQKVTVATSASVNISGFTFEHTPAITQVVDANLVEETDAQALVTSLTSVLTTALGTTAIPGTSALVPSELIAGNTVFAKTGRFDEVLPIIVPVNTAIVGDELRSVRVYAGAATVTDSVKVLAGINRLKAVISDIVKNTAITKTSGNAATQVVTRPAGSTGAGSKAEGLIQELYDYIDWGVNGASVDSTVPLSTGSNFTVSDTGYTHAVEVLEANRTFIKAEIIAFITDAYPSYTGYATKCERDLDFFIDAVQYDLVHNTGASGVRPYEGNYKTLHYARYYVNSTTGNALEDMFYMRNATGLRNMSLNGLAGGLGSANAFGTSRPTAGAFISLDPGWGPDDTRTWITTKSPYAQNVTNFGDGCIGLKVDGSIHNGGYDSVVANDFTQIINDGIGAWVTNLARVELVSVFTYYCHIGYLAENGGKIRATNGNNSYGNFGSVAEKTDDNEVAITGTVDNRSTEANINQVITNGDDILTFEFLNAGVNYTVPGTTITPAGDGFGAVIASSNVKNGAVYEVRLLDPADNLGGTGYVTASGKAQAGNLTSITISNTDTGSNTTYIGMNVFITSGVGSGQFGYIDTFNSTSKVATVRKHSDGNAGWDHVLGDDSSTYPTLDDTTTYIIEPRVTFASPPSGHPWDDCAKGRAKVSDGKIEHIRIWDPGSGYVSAPSMTLTDPNNTVDAPNLVRIGNGVLTQPTWTNRGTDFETATATVSGDGYADTYQPGNYIRIAGMSGIPQDGANIAFGGIPSTWYKLVQTTGLTGTPGTYTGLVQLSPKVSVTNAPEHGESVDFTIRYSQVRLTGHDFLDVGTGDFTETNYPGTPSINPDQTKETNDFGGGRCFYTATDQDGNFRVGELFNIEQSTGIATLNAEAFNISGLQSLQLGAVELGGTGAVITEFSTDGTFTANSDEIVPTQRAIKTYISSQIGGGAGELNVNSMVAGVVQINSNQITTTTGVAINIASSINFQAGVSGQPLAINYFLKA